MADYQAPIADMLFALNPVDGDQAYVNPATGVFPRLTPPVLLTQVIVAL